MKNGKQLVLQAMRGGATDRVPVMLLNWGYDYTWKVAGLEPWELARGGSETWHEAHLALVERHQPDAFIYAGAGAGPNDPILLDEDKERWLIRDNNNGIVYGLTKDSYTWYEVESGRRTCDPVGDINSVADVDRLIPVPAGEAEEDHAGLRRLIEAVGDRALVFPIHTPAYIRTCYAMGFEKAMLTMVDDPDLFFYTCERYAAHDLDRMHALARAGADAVFIADGWASADIISPEMFERFALPYQDSVVRAAQEAGLLTVLWNEGDVMPFLDMEASLTVDAFAFEQPRKGWDLDLAKVRAVFGPDRCLFGNLDSERLFMRNDPAEIAAAVAEQLRRSGPGAPFVLCTGSPIPSNVELSAVDAMIEAVRPV